MKSEENSELISHFEGIHGKKSAMRGDSSVRNTPISSDEASFSADPPVTENISGEKVGRPTVSITKKPSDWTTHATRQAVGQRIVYFTQYSDGLLEIEKEKFRRIKPKVTSLKDIWIPERIGQYDFFIHELIRNRVITEGMQWLYGSVSVIHCYKFLEDKGVVKKALPWTDVFKGFGGTFQLIKVKHARSLQDRKNKTVQYFKQARKWKDFFYQRFFFVQ